VSRFSRKGLLFLIFKQSVMQSGGEALPETESENVELGY